MATKDRAPHSTLLSSFLVSDNLLARALLPGSELKDQGWSPLQPSLLPQPSTQAGPPSTGTLPSDMLDSWNIVSKAWWISAKEGRSEGFHCQPGQMRPSQTTQEALLTITSVWLAILKKRSRIERSIPLLLPTFWCDKLSDEGHCVLLDIKNLKRLDTSRNMNCKTPERCWQLELHLQIFVSQPHSSKCTDLLSQTGRLRLYPYFTIIKAPNPHQ